TRANGNTFAINMPNPKPNSPAPSGKPPAAIAQQPAKAAPEFSQDKQDKLDAAIAAGLKNLQGQWIFEKAERDGAGRVSLLEESNYPALYIENDLVRGTNKSGALHSNSGRAQISIDPTATPMTMDIVLQNDDPG